MSRSGKSDSSKSSTSIERLGSAGANSQCMACLHSGVVGSELTKDGCPLRVRSKCANAVPECILCARANEVHSLFPVADQKLRELQSFSFAESKKPQYHRLQHRK